MVAKPLLQVSCVVFRYLLAKIHMVAKLVSFFINIQICYLLAKIHMVAKHAGASNSASTCYLLAKIHMVAKPKDMRQDIAL